MADRFCPYCRTWKLDEGFKTIFHLATRSKRMQCPGCQKTRQRPRPELVKEAAADSAARRAAISVATKRGVENRRKSKVVDGEGQA